MVATLDVVLAGHHVLLAAAVQGMDETVNNGAQALYLEQLNVTTRRFPKKTVDNLTGLIVGARMSWATFPHTLG